MIWDWGWIYKMMYFQDCRIGIVMDIDFFVVGFIILIDSWFERVGIVVFIICDLEEIYGINGMFVMENVLFNSVQRIVEGLNGIIVDRINVMENFDDVFVMVCLINLGKQYNLLILILIGICC